MAIEIDVDINPLDLLHSGDKFTFKPGQVFVTGEFVAEDGGEYIVPDQASIIQD